MKVRAVDGTGTVYAPNIARERDGTTKGACSLPVDNELSQQLSRALSFRQNLSYRGLLQVLQWLPELDAGYYVEGWAVAADHFQVFGHSWLELTGRIVDPLRYRSWLYYFPGVRFDKEAIARTVAEDEKLISAVEDGPFVYRRCGSKLDKADIQQSHQAAQAFADTLMEKLDWMRDTTGRDRISEGEERDGALSLGGDVLHAKAGASQS